MNKLKKILILIFLSCTLFMIFKYNFLLAKTINDAVSLWLNKVFPSLFIMFIFNDIIINTNILDIFSNLINPYFNKIFKTSGNASLVFILSIISGSPTNAYIIMEMLKDGQIDQVTASKLIAFTYFSNPLFLYNILSSIFNNFITWKIIIIHYLTNIIIGLIFRKPASNSNHHDDPLKEAPSLFLIIPQSIMKSMNTLLMILGTITFYMLISNLIIYSWHLPPIFTIILKGFLEITQGLNELKHLPILSIIKEIMALAIISFGGLSIHTQVLAILNDRQLYHNYLMGRIYHVLLSTLTYIGIYIILIS